MVSKNFNLIFLCKLIFLLSAFTLLIFQFGCSKSPESFATFTVKRGTNISHWLSQSDRRGEERKAWFTKTDVIYLTELGFDHLRIPIDEEQMWNEQNQMEPEAFELLNAALEWCRDSGLRAIVDLHILRSHHFNEGDKPLWTDSTAQNRFLDCWRDLSSQLKKWPNGMVAYELMNEPVADDPNDWNKLLAKAVKVVRELEPERVLVIGSNRWQIVDTFEQLQVPENDPNILLSFHFYTPFLLTHHLASWTSIKDYTGPVHYPGWTITEEELKDVSDSLKAQIAVHNGDFNRDVLLQLIEKPLRIAQKYDLPLYCGEWGSYHMAPRPDSWRWYGDMCSILEEKGIGWATWDYKGGFGIIDREGKPVTELIQILLPK